MTERLFLFDTTLRDGQQTQGVQFSTAEKRQIALALDELGLDYIEGGWPGANPTDSDFFAAAPATRATMTAFGMTQRVGRSAANDDVLAAVLDAGTPAVCLVGKTHEFHVTHGPGGYAGGEPSRRSQTSVAHVVGAAARRCSMPSISSTATAPTPAMPWPVCGRRCGPGRAGSSCATPTAAPCPPTVGRITAEVIAAGIPGDATWHPLP